MFHKWPSHFLNAFKESSRKQIYAKITGCQNWAPPREEIHIPERLLEIIVFQFVQKSERYYANSSIVNCNCLRCKAHLRVLANLGWSLDLTFGEFKIICKVNECFMNDPPFSKTLSKQVARSKIYAKITGCQNRAPPKEEMQTPKRLLEMACLSNTTST